jgi:hypothetical protein
MVVFLVTKITIPLIKKTTAQINAKDNIDIISPGSKLL